MMLPTQEVIKYLNLAREYPKYYVALVEEQLNSFTNATHLQLAADLFYETIEGKPAWEEARLFLLDQQPLRPLEYHVGLAKSAHDHAVDQLKCGNSGHAGSDGSSFIDRIQRYSRKGKGSMIELLGSTHKVPGRNSIEMAVINLLVDDGVANRGHRRALFNKDYKYVGAEFGEEGERIVAVVAMSQSNLELIPTEGNSIATSTSHLTSSSLISNLQPKEQTVRKSKENCIDVLPTRQSSNDPSWTFKNVTNEQKPGEVKRQSKQIGQIVEAQFTGEPSIMKEMDQSIRSSRVSHDTSRQNLPVSNLQPTNEKIEPPVKQSTQSIHSNKSSQPQIKESSLSGKGSQHSFSRSGDNFGHSSEVERFKMKSSIQSPFLKTNTFSNCPSSTSRNRKVVEKKETMRSWDEQEYLIKEITTIVKYEDGSVEDFVEKHSLLKSSLLKEHSL